MGCLARVEVSYYDQGWKPLVVLSHVLLVVIKQ